MINLFLIIYLVLFKQSAEGGSPAVSVYRGDNTTLYLTIRDNSCVEASLKLNDIIGPTRTNSNTTDDSRRSGMFQNFTVTFSGQDKTDPET